MSETERPTPATCASARAAIHARLDGEPPASWAEVENHLETCSDCRELATDLEAMQSALQGLDPGAFPDVALRRVWARTSRAHTVPRWHAAAWGAMAASLLLALGLALWPQLGTAPSPHEPTQAELQEAAEQARLVLGLTSSALKRASQVGVRGVLSDGASALRRARIAWPSTEAEDSDSKGSI